MFKKIPRHISLLKFTPARLTLASKPSCVRMRGNVHEKQLYNYNVFVIVPYIYSSVLAI